MQALTRSPARPGLTLSSILLCLLLASPGCKNKKAEYHQQLDGKWQALQQQLQTGELDTGKRIARLEAFLTLHPADHEHGNPHAAAIAKQLSELRTTQKTEQQAQAEQQAQSQQREALWPLVEGYLFDLVVGAGAGYPGEPDPVSVLSFQLGDARQMTRGRFGGPLLDALRAAPLKAVHKLLKRTLYDPDKGYDAESLKQFLDTLTVKAEHKLLGVTARELYPFFTNAVDFHLQIHTALNEKIGADKLAELRSAFVAAQGEGEPDLREFYTELSKSQPSLNRGIEHFASSHALEVGFWVRRIEDGTAPVLSAFLQRISSELGRPPSDGEPLPELEVDPAVPLSGDRMFRVSKSSWSAAEFAPNGEYLAHIGLQGLQLRSSKSGEIFYTKKLAAPGWWEKLAYSSHGKVIAAAVSAKLKGQKGHVYLFDAESGEQLSDCGGDADYFFIDLAFSHDDKHLVARTIKHGLRIWEVGDPCTGIAVGMPPGSKANRAFNFPMAVHPKRPLLVMARNDALVVYDMEKKTETEVARRKDVRELRFSPAGHNLLVATDQRLFIETFNISTGQLSGAQTIDQRSSGSRWLPSSDTVVFLSRDDGLAYVWKVGADQQRARYAGSEILTVSPDRKTLVMREGLQDIKLWALGTR